MYYYFMKNKSFLASLLLPISIYAQIWDDGLAEKYIDTPGDYMKFSGELGYDGGTRQKGIFFFLYPSNKSSCSGNLEAEDVLKINNNPVEGILFEQTFPNSDNCYIQIVPKSPKDLDIIISQFIKSKEVLFNYRSFEISIPTDGFESKWNSMEKEIP